MYDPLQGLRLMGPAQILFDLNLVWFFTRDGEELSTNQLTYWADTRAFTATNKAKAGSYGEITYQMWPEVSASRLVTLLSDEEKAKAVAASLGVNPCKDETGWKA
ncbi:hypothetical protein J2045_003382 [Peteryoungia aggregata LMG 23059]|uniref:Uncharacterized protein n=1 Tax=Peteryoungia aggregata LMG 23059 TaxID=1368425 RepID=A0ABU0GBL7_9HYPH|nr:hypothetical protein [Peteryoungia aggregata]MDQ0422334.1 hypothetical protein [Peteryoungia aggregata LMG 23059]